MKKTINFGIIKILIIYLILLLGSICEANEGSSESVTVNSTDKKDELQIDVNVKPEDIVDIKKIAPKIYVQLAYFEDKNFVGEPINGYSANKCFLQKQAAEALKRASEDISEFGYILRIFDCYRPQKAVDHFVSWAKNLDDKKTKNQFYPNVKKNKLFEKGYIAEKSGHSNGHTIDVTIGRPSGLKIPFELNMGTPYDFFDERSHTNSRKNSREAIKNRMLLKMVLEKHGFENYDKEWWHFSFKENKYKDISFNFDIK